MSSLSSIKRNVARSKVKQATGVTPKEKCPYCKTMSVFKKTESGYECYMCHKEITLKEYMDKKRGRK